MEAVLITGASAGIGDAFARQLAAEGYNLVLAARRLPALQRLGEELAASFNIEVVALECDLASPDAVARLIHDLDTRAIRLVGLINNAGFGDRGPFKDLPLPRQMSMIQVNVNALVALTWQVLPQLSNARDAFIINVASTAAFQAGPNMAVYYATKAFVLSFSEALHEELRGQSIEVSTLCPGATRTEFAEQANMSGTRLFRAGTMQPRDVVRQALEHRRRAIVVTGWRNRLLVWLGKFSPRLVNRRIAAWLQA